MIGGEFVSHGAQQVVTIDIVDSEFPGMDKGFGTLAPRSRSTTSGTLSRTCPRTCTSSWSRTPRG